MTGGLGVVSPDGGVGGAPVVVVVVVVGVVVGMSTMPGHISPGQFTVEPKKM